MNDEPDVAEVAAKLVVLVEDLQSKVHKLETMNRRALENFVRMLRHARDTDKIDGLLQRYEAALTELIERDAADIDWDKVIQDILDS